MMRILSIVVILISVQSLWAQNPDSCNIINENFDSYIPMFGIISQTDNEWILYYPNAVEPNILFDGSADPDHELNIGSNFNQSFTTTPQAIQLINDNTPGIYDLTFNFYDECGGLSLRFLESFTDTFNQVVIADIAHIYDSIRINGQAYPQCFNFSNDFNPIHIRLNFFTDSLTVFCLGQDYKLPFLQAADSLFGIAWGSNQCAFVDDICVTITTITQDMDNDGFNSDEDCDDGNPDINPDAIEIPDNGIDENCDGEDLTTTTIEIAEHKIDIFPNPFSSQLKIQSDDWISSNLKISIFSAEGKVIYQLNVHANQLLNTIAWNNGLYFLKIENSSRRESRIIRLLKLEE